MEPLPPARPGTALRVLATTDLAGTLIPPSTSYGQGGTCAGVAELLERERDRQPTVWLDAGDFTVGPAAPLLGERPWADVADLPIAAAAAGNHEFDDGVPALLEAARLLPFPLLCGNVDIGLPGTTLIDSGAGPIGVIGLTHPQVERFTRAPTVANNWSDQVASSAHELRARGARWVVSLLHDGVVWWPSMNGPKGPIETRSDALDEHARPWAEHVDVILCAHTHGGWVGQLAGTPAGQAYSFASSVLVVDLAE